MGGPGQLPRKYERVRVGGFIRMMADTPRGLCVASGSLVDISEGGCSVFVKTRIAEYVPARIQVELAGTQLWLPVMTRWATCDARGWTIGCEFDRPTEEKQRAIRALVWERRKVTRN
jgi:hypothetical protein